MKIFNKSEWKKVKLGDICEVLDSKRIPISEEKRIKGEYPYYGANGIQGYINDYIFDEELVLLAEDGGNFASKTKPIAYKITGKAWVNNHAHVLKAKDEVISTDFLLYSLMFYDVTKLITGTTRKKLTKTGMEKITLSIPTLIVQNKITNYLQKIEKFIFLRKNQLNFLNELNKSLFTTMFGDILNNSLNWRQVKLEDLCSSIVRGPFGSSLKKEFFVKNGYKVYEQKNAINQSADLGEYYINEEKFKELKRFECKTGDIIMSCSGTVGKLFQLPEDSKKGVINQALCKFSLNNKTVSIYFLKCLEKIMENLKLNGSGIKNISSVSYLRKIDISLPPIELQNKFAERIKKIEKLKFEIEKSIEMAQNLYNSLISKYFDN